MTNEQILDLYKFLGVTWGSCVTAFGISWKALDVWKDVRRSDHQKDIQIARENSMGVTLGQKLIERMDSIEQDVREVGSSHTESMAEIIGILRTGK